MGQWWRKLRGLTVLTSIGGLLGGLAGGAMVAVSAIRDGSTLLIGEILTGAGIFAGFSAIATAGVGVLLVTVASGRRLSELPVGKAGLVGALLGAAGPTVFLLVSGGWGLPLALFARIGLQFGFVGGLLGAGLVAVAKRADAKSLDEPDDLFLPVRD